MALFMKRSGVAVVELFGTIGGGVRVPVYSQLLDGIRRSKRIKAVVLDIDSPGGTAPGSELLYHSLSRGGQRKTRCGLRAGDRRLRRLLHQLRRQQDRRVAIVARRLNRRDIYAACASTVA